MASSLAAGWRIQRRVIGALMIRELITRFGRENIGFLWVMVEPLLFGLLVGLIWRYAKGPEEHGVSIIAFVVTGYLPLTLFRNSVNRAVKVFTVNSSLMYHRQITLVDFIFVRFLIEMIGAMMAYLVVGVLLIYFDAFPVPYNIGWLITGWFLYSAFTLSLCFVLAPLSEMSDVLEKLMPVTTYVIIPFSGTFNMASWVTPSAREFLLYSPFVNCMEMMRYGVFGDNVTPYFGFGVPITATMVLFAIGLTLCRKVRRTLVVE
jgi:capsular polysaccharide transport system permease protein